MMRSLTILCAVSAGLSGLFLYSKKHQTTLLDRQITDIVHNTQHIRQQTAMLRTEWALLNQPDRLTGLAARFTPDLQPMEPSQFVRQADLASRLPAPDAGRSVHAPSRTETPATEAAILASAAPQPVQPHAEHPIQVVAARQITPRPAIPRPAVVLASAAATPVAPASVTPAVRHTVHPAVLAEDTSRLPELRHEPVHVALAKPVPAELPHHAARSAMQLADATPQPRHTEAAVSARKAERHPDSVIKAAPTELASVTHVRSTASLPVTRVAAWRPVRTASTTLASASMQSGRSLLGRSSLSDELPPPVPLSN
ncbi:ABC transporter permease [Acetobacter sp. AN02]|uniref:cell division protein FtsL n=1 Tax=Acetobacter sp. AN02 TaxID=2894186 RepID=UPI00243455B6|nr:ABC transporter permease [Acetobacter sp. AN02]MDG6094208.1 ABC transporter permease [Acetobacter sp. AN02]